MRISDWSSDVCSSDLQPDVHQCQCLLQPGGHRAVGRARLGAARGMVVRDDHRRGIRRQGRLHHFAWMYLGAVDRSAEQLDELQHAMARVQQDRRSEEHTSELQSLMRNSYAVFCLKKKKKH